MAALNGLTPAKLLFKPMSAMIGIAGFASAGGTTETVKAALQSALATAGDGGVSVPLQAAVYSRAQASFVEGVDTVDPFNKVAIYSGQTRKRATDGNGNDLFAKIATASGDWTLAYFSTIAGVDTAFAMPAGTVIDLEVPYIFTLDHWPSRTFTAPTERHVAPDLAAYAWRKTKDRLIISAQNTTTTTLSKTYDGREATLNLFGIIFTDDGPNPFFTITGGNTFTWNAANAGVNLDVGDNPLLTYTY